MIARALEPVTRAPGSPPLWLAALSAAAVQPRHRGRRVGDRRDRRVRHGGAHAAIPHRPVGHAPVGRPQPDRAAHRPRAARAALGRAARDRSVPLGGLDVGRGDRELSRLLPRLDRGTARVLVTGCRAPRPDALLRRRAGGAPSSPCGCRRASPTCCPRCGSPPSTRSSARWSPRCRSACAAESDDRSSSTRPAAAPTPPSSGRPIFGAILMGLVAAGAVALIGVLLRRYRRTEVNA